MEEFARFEPRRSCSLLWFSLIFFMNQWLNRSFTSWFHVWGICEEMKLQVDNILHLSVDLSSKRKWNFGLICSETGLMRKSLQLCVTALPSLHQDSEVLKPHLWSSSSVSLKHKTSYGQIWVTRQKWEVRKTELSSQSLNNESFFYIKPFYIVVWLL